jgi:hypothetical protein
MATDEDIAFPLGSTDERELFLSWLRYLRGAVLRKLDGLDDEQARWRADERLLPLLGIVHDLTNVESRWIDGGFVGGPVDRAENEPLDLAGLNLEACVPAYHERADATERTVRTRPLDTPHPYGPDVNLRWVLLHSTKQLGTRGTPIAFANSSTAPSASSPPAGVMGASACRSGAVNVVAARAHRGHYACDGRPRRFRTVGCPRRRGFDRRTGFGELPEGGRDDQ